MSCHRKSARTFNISIRTFVYRFQDVHLLSEYQREGYERRIWGTVHSRTRTGYFEAEEQGIRYEAGPVTFLQVNENVRAKLYEAALKAVVSTGDEVVVDAYSGGGLLTAMLAKSCKRAYGIELEAEAVKCADALKEKNGLSNMTNICGYVEEKLQGVLEKEQGEEIRLILDPPRAGIARIVVRAILESGISKIAIISCNPATLARDLGPFDGQPRRKGRRADQEFRVRGFKRV